MKKLLTLAASDLKEVTKTYQGEYRPWMDDVDENGIEREIRSAEFAAFVEEIVNDALYGSVSIAG